MAESDLPKISRPAERALRSVGVTRLGQLTKFRETEIAALHGMGPKGVRILKAALTEKGLSFRKS
jgi:hypothetical protein